MEIRIHIPRPIVTLSIIAVGFLWWNGVISFHLPSTITGSLTSEEFGGEMPSLTIAHAIQDIDRERTKQAVLLQREEILRYQVQLLENEALSTQSSHDVQSLQEARSALLGLIQERTSSEKLLTLSLQELWDAQGSAFTLEGIESTTKILWPISPRRGVSAFFEDAEYKDRFKIDHHAIDIPVPQGTEIQAPADGLVLKVAENGLGFSYIVLEHIDGMQTVYGHISEALVREGDQVHAGDAIALSGGKPGTKGAGLLTTGPHLHFAVKIHGALVDPLKYLPKI